jgi:hypothetical protein
VKKKKISRLSVDISEDLKKKFCRACKKVDLDMSHVTRYLIEDFLEDQEMIPSYFSRLKRRRSYEGGI